MALETVLSQLIKLIKKEIMLIPHCDGINCVTNKDTGINNSCMLSRKPDTLTKRLSAFLLLCEFQGKSPMHDTE